MTNGKQLPMFQWTEE